MSNEMRDKMAEAEEWIEKYPFLRIKDNSVYPWLNTEEIEEHWLQEIPQGWLDAFGKQMCDELLEALGDYADDWIIAQVKEKFGELRVYHYFADDDRIEAEEQELEEIKYKIDEIVDRYSHVSYRTCVECGSAADVRTVNGWVAPYCKSCYEKRV